MEGSDISRFLNPAHALKFPYKIFVKGHEVNNESSNSAQNCLSNISKNKTLSGKDTKKFYESLITEDLSSNNSPKHVKECSNLKLKESVTPAINQLRCVSKQSDKHKIGKSSKLSRNDIIMAIENDDTQPLKIALNKGLKISCEINTALHYIALKELSGL